jgi:UDPglucose--hexose-1-phosphate uridylyltransferase
LGELREDPVNGRWVIVTTESPKGPSDFEREKELYRKGPCPFCYGNEYMTPPEIEVIRKSGTAANTQGWLVRTVANKFPALRIEGDLVSSSTGVYDILNGVGAHEVIIETPSHEKDLSDLSADEITMVIDMYCRRSMDLSNDHRLKYILIFKNQGYSAGATIEHPHTQLIALPMIPKNVIEELHGASFYFGVNERCVFCDILKQELDEKVRILMENDSFVSFCPYASRFAFEVRIMPKVHSEKFCAVDWKQKRDLAEVMKNTLLRLKAILGIHPYNFLINSTPLDRKSYNYYHWYIEIMPRLSRIAGFEWGSGFYVQTTPPELAARLLKEAKI